MSLGWIAFMVWASGGAAFAVQTYEWTVKWNKEAGESRKIDRYELLAIALFSIFWPLVIVWLVMKEFLGWRNR